MKALLAAVVLVWLPVPDALGPSPDQWAQRERPDLMEPHVRVAWEAPDDSPVPAPGVGRSPQPVPPRLLLTFDDLRPILAAYDWPVDEALRVAACESLGPDGLTLELINIHARNVRPCCGTGTHASGMWQHIPYWFYDRARAAGIENADPFDPVTSTAVAYWLWQDGGGFHRHWQASESCWGPES